MRKTISLMLVAVMLVACMTVTAFAAHAGDTVEVTMTATGNVPFNSFAGSFSYDTSVLTINSIVSSGYGAGNGNKLSYSSPTMDVTSTTYTLNITISADAKPGTYTITGSSTYAYDTSYDPAKDDEYVQPVVTFYAEVVVECEHDAGTPVKEVHIEGDCVIDRCVDTVTKCSKCGEELSRTHNVTTAPGHKYEVTDHKDATCTENGYNVYTCACGDTYTETINAPGHDYVLTNSTTGADCKTVGKDTYTCSCGDSYSVDNNNVGPHKYEEGKYEKDDTHHWTVCTVCDAATEKHPHNFVDNGGEKLECVCGATKDKATTPTNTQPTNPGAGGDMGDTTPYPVFILMAVAAVMGTAYGFKRKFEI